MNTKEVLLSSMTTEQKDAIGDPSRQLLLIAGAGSGKTEVMSRRVCWWTTVDGVPKENVVAFTFTERAAEEMKFRIRRQLQTVTTEGTDATLGGMYVGTIHGYCLQTLREMLPDKFYSFDVLDEGARIGLVQRAYHHTLGLKGLEQASQKGQYATIEYFLKAYDLLNEYAALDVELPPGPVPHISGTESEWVKKAVLNTNVGDSDEAQAFAISAARFYAYLQCRRFLDFSTTQSELLRATCNPQFLSDLRQRVSRLVVDEVQDINPVQYKLIEAIVGKTGYLTAVGDHRQAIFAWRGGSVELMNRLRKKIDKAPDGKVLELSANFRSVPRVINVANEWASSITPFDKKTVASMKHGNGNRIDFENAHCAAITLPSRHDEAKWIADSITQLVRATEGRGARHDKREGQRGLHYSDIAVLLRSSTDARLYMETLESKGIPAVFRAGPDLFAQPEVLLLIGALGVSAGLIEFYTAGHRGLRQIAQDVLGCQPTPKLVIAAACQRLASRGLGLKADVTKRLITAGELIHNRINGATNIDPKHIAKLQHPELRKWLKGKSPLRRVFPQTIFQFLLSEAGVADWDNPAVKQTILFHLGALSSLVKSVETPGWTSPTDFKYQIIALYLWGASNARTDEAPLLVQPQAVTISTIHAAKGLEYSAVFVADVATRRFPSQRARTTDRLPMSGTILTTIDPTKLADNTNLDNERRLMYVALTRAERYLFVSTSTESPFFKELKQIVQKVGGKVSTGPFDLEKSLSHLPTEVSDEVRLSTSFSDLRYYIECPHDFFLRKVLGFAPSIDQAFGYGRGVHNLMRAVHTNPKAWAALASDKLALRNKLDALAKDGLFYLRYTTGEPLELMRTHAVDIVSSYVVTYRDELQKITFEPEKAFETLIPEEQVLVSGAIDVVRLDDPPRVTLIDFKSGESESDLASKLTEEEMKLQVSLYGLAAKHELEYEPDRGLVRYLDEKDAAKSEIVVDLAAEALAAARQTVIQTAGNIRQRKFHVGPKPLPGGGNRCKGCDFLGFCGMPEAQAERLKASQN